VLAVLVAVRVGGCDARDLGLDREQLGHGLRLGAAAAALFALVLAVGAVLPATRDLFADRRVDPHSVTLLLYHTLVRIPLGTVVLEETLFRGVLLGLALRRWSPPAAVAYSSVLFGLWHLLPARGVSGSTPWWPPPPRAPRARCWYSCSPSRRPPWRRRLVLAAPARPQPRRPRRAAPGRQQPRLPPRLDRAALHSLTGATRSGSAWSQPGGVGAAIGRAIPQLRQYACALGGAR
jgi:hypothetical protein